VSTSRVFVCCEFKNNRVGVYLVSEIAAELYFYNVLRFILLCCWEIGVTTSKHFCLGN
jgi:hypothetical protein